MKRVAFLAVAITIFLFSLGAIDFWIFRLWQGSTALYHYWIAIGLAFISFGVCLATIMWISDPKTKPAMLLGVFLTPFILFVAGIWDWIIYFIYTYYGASYPDYKIWAAQARWFGHWDTSLQILWSLGFLGLLAIVWYCILRKK